MTSLHDWQTWEPLVDALRESAPPGTRVSEFEGWVSTRSAGGSFTDDGDGERRTRAHRAQAREAAAAARAGRPVKGPRDAWDAALRELRAVAPAGGVPFVVRAEARPEDDTVRIVGLPPHVTRGASSPLGDVLLADGALPAPYRERLVPRPDAATAPSADADAVARVVRGALPDAAPATADQLDAVEATLGSALPDEVRALYLAAGSGALTLTGVDPHRDAEQSGDLFPGFEILPLDEDLLRHAFLPRSRFSGWSRCAGTVPPADPDGRVQRAVGSPLWFPVGHDGGGNVYAVDLAPGPRGHLGQVLLLDHERPAGASFRAESLARLLVDRRTGPAEGTGRGEVGAGADDAPAPEVLTLPAAGGPHVVSAAVGQEVRTVQAAAGALADPLQLATLPRLEYLGIAPADWRVLLAADAVPPTLLAAGFGLDRPRLDEAVEVANRLLALRGREPVTMTEVRRPARESLLSRLFDRD